MLYTLTFILVTTSKILCFCELNLKRDKQYIEPNEELQILLNFML